MMTPEQRYWFDLTGYLHLKQVLERDELRAAQAAVDRYVTTPPDDLPSGFEHDDKDPRRYVHGFAFDPALEALTHHPSIWPIVKELTNNKPRLVSGTLTVNHPHVADEVLRLHCARDDYGWESVRYQIQNGRIYCDDIVVFPYLTDVYPGDGGLLVVPGSHKAAFERPPTMFNNGVVEDELPPGVLNITPRAGDILIITEALTHGALPWRPRDRSRQFLVLRYKPQYRGQEHYVPETVRGRLSAETQELLSFAHYTHTKQIVCE
ncbi:MAG: phytanoyl-CoA dioxygenase family protein [Chloroflexota bacterium]